MVLPKPMISNNEFKIWQLLIEERCGLYFRESKSDYLSSKLWQRTELLGIKTYNNYYNYIVFNSRGKEEWEKLVELLVINETSFFRHTSSFDVLANSIVPKLINSSSKTSISAWSAGCATGEEAYSLVMTLLDFSETYNLEVVVLGTDISELVLERARNGIYKAAILKQISPYHKDKYLDFVKEGSNHFYKIKDEIKNTVKFSKVNLSKLIDCPVLEQDIIFCQNVLIYFQPQQQIKVVKELGQRLKVGGFLFLGPGEIVELKAEHLQKLAFDDCLIYQRIK
ncbi:MAG: hypothetical protein HY819_13285 [Acidobacteria bacterium]|nr:hypothetical protein [Acidobacteriota bacterium]